MNKIKAGYPDEMLFLKPGKKTVFPLHIEKSTVN